MPKAAAAYGLHIDRWVDERLDPERSTDAALDYLSDLHTRFGRWELAFAAYNMGHGGLLTAIRKYNTNDYWELSAFEDGVPYETALYVPKILALAFVAHNRSVFGCDTIALDAPEPFIPVLKQKPGAVKDGAKIKAPAAAHTASVTAVTGTPAPAISGATSVAIPITQNVTKVTLRWGESLENLALDHGTTESRLRAMNGLGSPTPPRPGTSLYVPNGAATPSTEKFVAVVPAGANGSPDRKRILYEVVWGDQIEDVARALDVTVGEICQWNDIDPTARLHGKMVLEAFVPKDAKLDDVRYVDAAKADLLTAGTQAFFDYFEGKNGRKRVTLKVASGDTWASIAKKNGISVALLERINQRSHLSKLSPGEQVVVYTHSNEKAAVRAAA
jgi:membrane-bound lytic murein transglycosylase D